MIRFSLKSQLFKLKSNNTVGIIRFTSVRAESISSGSWAVLISYPFWLNNNHYSHFFTLTSLFSPTFKNSVSIAL